MKLIIVFALLLLSFTKQHCNKHSTAGKMYKGRLEIKGICMNYTIRLIAGNIDTSMIASSWTDEMTGKSYKNVFALGSPCTFPASIEQGDEFLFTIDTSKAQPCQVCLAYYPKPHKYLFIKVADK